MHRTKMLVASATAVLMAGMGIAIAQQEPPRSAPAEKIAPGAKQPSAMPHQNRGVSNAPAVRNEGPNTSHRGEATQGRGRSETTGHAPKGDRNQATERNKSDQGRSKTERTEQNRTTGQAPREDRTNRASEQNKSEQDRARTDRTEENRTTTGQGAAGTRTNVNVNIAPEKRTQIHEIIVKERSAPRVTSVNFDLSVGTRVPRNVRFVALPPSIVTIEPDLRGYDYFMVGDRIVVVNPRTMEIVAIIDV